MRRASWARIAGVDELIQRCIAGDSDAWRRFVDQAAPVIYAAVRRVLSAPGRASDPDAASDIAQEVFVRLLKDDSRLLRRFDPARASLTTYLTVIAHSTAIDQTRRRAIPTQPLDTAPDPAAAPPRQYRKHWLAEPHPYQHASGNHP